MKSWKKFSLGTIALASVCLGVNVSMVGCKSHSPKQYIYLGNIITMNGHQRAQAVVVRDGIITFVGKKEDALKLANDNTEIKDYGNNSIYPGFMDGHAHGNRVGLTETATCLFTNDMEITQCTDKLVEFVRQHPDFPSYFGQGWQRHEGHQYDREPTWVDIDNAFEAAGVDIGDKWVVLNSEDLHQVWVNKNVLDWFPITKEVADYIGHDVIHVFEEGPHKGEPNGIMLDSMHVIVNALTQYSNQQLRNAYLAYQNFCFKNGYTASNDCAMYEFPWASLVSVAGTMAARRELKMRLFGNMYIVEMLPSESQFEWMPTQEWLLERAIDLSKKYNSDHFKIIGTKIFIDGVVEGRTAYLLENYEDAIAGTEDRGYHRYTGQMEQMSHIIEESNLNGLSTHIHAVGDGAVRSAIDAIEEVQQKTQKYDARNVVLHCQLVSDEDKPRFKQNNIIAGLAPLWCPIHPVYGPIEDTYIGAERKGNCYPIKSISDTGAVTFYHTDVPVSSDYSIKKSIYEACYREKPDADDPVLTRRSNRKDEMLGLDDETSYWYKPGRYEAIQSMTYNTAYEFGMEKELGSIEYGKRADFTIFDTDFETCDRYKIMDAKIISTIVDGKIVYTNPEFK